MKSNWFIIFTIIIIILFSGLAMTAILLDNTTITTPVERDAMLIERMGINYYGHNVTYSEAYQQLLDEGYTFNPSAPIIAHIVTYFLLGIITWLVIFFAKKALST